MQRDANGELLRKDDIVYLPCTIHQLEQDDHIMVRTIIPHPNIGGSMYVVHAGQAVKDPSNVSYDKAMLVTWGKDSL